MCDIPMEHPVSCPMDVGQYTLKKRLDKARGELQSNQTENAESEGISWGFQEDAEEEDNYGAENSIQDIEANLDKPGDVSLVSVEAEKMAKRRQVDGSDEELYDKTCKHLIVCLFTV
ncbi:unnamed protein product [Mucor fragilis]